MSVGLGCVPLMMRADEVRPDTVGVMLEEVNVAGVKQMARLNDEPEAATVLSGSALERLGVAAIKGISNLGCGSQLLRAGLRFTHDLVNLCEGHRRTHGSAVGRVER